jgi:hypothetical protein
MRLLKLLFAVLLLSTPASAQAPAPFDFITHNEVVINASPAAVWPHLRNVNAWKAGAKAFPFDGTPGAVGERFKAAAAADAVSFYFIETVELTQPTRWTIRLNTQAGELMGYATWTLAAAPGGTLLRYDTFLLSRPAEVLPSPEARAAFAARTNREAAQRMDSEFLRLKQLVESAGAKPSGPADK